MKPLLPDPPERKLVDLAGEWNMPPGELIGVINARLVNGRLPLYVWLSNAETVSPGPAGSAVYYNGPVMLDPWTIDTLRHTGEVRLHRAIESFKGRRAVYIDFPPCDGPVITMDDVFIRSEDLAAILGSEDQPKPENKNPDRKKTRIDNLRRAIQAANSVLTGELGHKPTAADVFQYLRDDRDETGVIDDSTDDKVIWIDSLGKPKDATQKAIANRLSRLRNPK